MAKRIAPSPSKSKEDETTTMCCQSGLRSISLPRHVTGKDLAIPDTCSEAPKNHKEEPSEPQQILSYIMDGMDGLRNGKVKRSQHARSRRSRSRSNCGGFLGLSSLGLESLQDEAVVVTEGVLHDDDDAGSQPKQAAPRRSRRRLSTLRQEKVAVDASNLHKVKGQFSDSFSTKSTITECDDDDDDDEKTVQGPNHVEVQEEVFDRDDRFVSFDGWVTLSSLVEHQP